MAYVKVLPSDLETPVSAFMKLRKVFPKGAAFLFESVEKGEQVGRYSILGFYPENMICWNAGSSENPLSLLEKALHDFKEKINSDLPFPAGSFGYLGYDAVRAFEKIPGPREKSQFPDAYFFVPKRMVLFDHVRNTMSLLVLEKKEECEKAVTEMEQGLFLALDFSPVCKDTVHETLFASETRESFVKKVEKAKEYIKAGEIFQVVLSQKIIEKTSAEPIDIYRALRILNPSPYMFFLDFDSFALVGSSPEMLIKVKDGIAETRPIAGTRKRGESFEEDSLLSKQLLEDPKERAEHVMLVDLGRNDLGRISSYGSVRVGSYMEVEKYSHVMHLVSSVVGKVKEEKSPLDVLQCAFPAGTVTGAPKVRAMEIIEELEGLPRGPYAGCVGYVSFEGNLDTCITIRTLIISSGRVWLQAGAGIVADSQPELEYEETLNKLEGMKQAIKMAESGLKIKHHDRHNR